MVGADAIGWATLDGKFYPRWRLPQKHAAMSFFTESVRVLERAADAAEAQVAALTDREAACAKAELIQISKEDEAIRYLDNKGDVHRCGLSKRSFYGLQALIAVTTAADVLRVSKATTNTTFDRKDAVGLEVKFGRGRNSSLHKITAYDPDTGKWVMKSVTTSQVVRVDAGNSWDVRQQVKAAWEKKRAEEAD